MALTDYYQLIELWELIGGCSEHFAGVIMQGHGRFQ